MIRTVLEGKDQLLVVATGGGKSLCFQLPALLLAEDATPKVTIVFSPLVALMSDQVAALQQKGVFSAIALNFLALDNSATRASQRNRTR